MARRQQPYLRQAGLRPDVDPDFASYPYRIPVVRELANIRFQPNVVSLSVRIAAVSPPCWRRLRCRSVAVAVPDFHLSDNVWC